MTGLQNARTLITGGCGDIGRAIAARFVREGARVALADIRPVEEGGKVAAEFGAIYTACDVTCTEQVRDCVAETVERLGGLDVVICSAGIVATATVLEADDEGWLRTLNVNLSGSFRVAREAAKAMSANPRSPGGRRGTIIFTGSWVQTMPWPQGASYCASKGGQQMLMKVLAQELANNGITCNIVAPGLVDAGLTKGLYERDEVFRERVGATVPLGRMCTADEVAGAFVFLAGHDAAYITGISLVVDGGASLVRR